MRFSIVALERSVQPLPGSPIRRASTGQRPDTVLPEWRRSRWPSSAREPLLCVQPKACRPPPGLSAIRVALRAELAPQNPEALADAAARPLGYSRPVLQPAPRFEMRFSIVALERSVQPLPGSPIRKASTGRGQIQPRQDGADRDCHDVPVAKFRNHRCWHCTPRLFVPNRQRIKVCFSQPLLRWLLGGC